MLSVDLTPTSSIIHVDGVCPPEEQLRFLGIAPNSRLTQARPFDLRVWTPDATAEQETKPGSTFVLVHGLGAHSGWFEGIGTRLANAGHRAISFDLPGFGQRQSMQSVTCDDWLLDTCRAFNWATKSPIKNSQHPVYLHGNSMGAIISLILAPVLKPAGLVLTSPGFEGHPKAFSLKWKLKALSTACFSGTTAVAVPYTIDQVARDKSIQDWLTADPFMLFAPPAKYFYQLLKLSWKLKKNSVSIPCPVQMYTAGKEMIVDNSASAAIFATLKAPSKHKQQFENAYHDLMFDPVLDELVERILTGFGIQC